MHGVLNDIRYLTRGCQFGNKLILDNCEKAKYGIEQIKGTCWFNATINGLLLGEYSRILLLKSLDEYLENNKIEIIENSCPLLNKHGIYQIIYNMVKLNTKPDRYSSIYLEKARKMHNIGKEDRGTAFESLINIFENLNLIYYVSNRRKFYLEVFNDFDQAKCFQHFYIYQSGVSFPEDRNTNGNTKDPVIPVKYINYLDGEYILNNIIFGFNSPKLSGPGHVVNIFYCNQKYYLNDSNLNNSYPLELDLDNLSQAGILKQLIKIYKNISNKFYYQEDISKILIDDSYIIIILVYAKVTLYENEAEKIVNQQEKELFQNLLTTKFKKFNRTLSKELKPEADRLIVDDFNKMFGNVLNDTKDMNIRQFAEYKKNKKTLYDEFNRKTTLDFISGKLK
jgi:hypothetical protein